MIQTCFSDRAWRKKLPASNTSWWDQSAYKVLAFVYQLGVFISRTSVQCFRFPWVSVLTGIQFVMFVLWMFAAIYTTFLNIWIQMGLMFVVGCMGGCSYSNCMYYVLQSPSLTKDKKEVTINISSMFYDAGIFLASILALIVSNFILT